MREGCSSLCMCVCVCVITLAATCTYIVYMYLIYTLNTCTINLRPVHNTTLNNVLRCVIFASTLVETQHNARIDSDPILAFLCVAFLCLVVKKSPTFLVINLCISRTNATQGLAASLCEQAFKLPMMFCTCIMWILLKTLPSLLLMDFRWTKQIAMALFKKISVYSTLYICRCRSYNLTDTSLVIVNCQIC